MIRRSLIIVGVATTLFGGIGFLSYTRQFGFVGSWQSIGMRNGILTYVTRVNPISDGVGLLIDDASAVNRTMYSIGAGAQWWQVAIWPWVLGILATVGYSLVLPPIRQLWKHPAPRGLIGMLMAACAFLAVLWTTSHLAWVTFDSTQVHFRLEEGTAVLFVDRQQTNAGIPWSTGWNVYRDFPPLIVGFDGYIRFEGGNFMLKLPLGILFVTLAIPTIVLARSDRRAWPGYCSRCAYDLTGNESGICPECGVPRLSANSSQPLSPCELQQQSH